jgi:NADPH-dependent F420 reductase
MHVPAPLQCRQARVVRLLSQVHTSLPSVAVVGGTGEQGRGLALRWSAAGYDVTIGSRASARARAEVEKLNRLHSNISLSSDDNKGAARGADIIVLTVPFKFQLSTVEDIATCLDGKILVDVTVPLVPPKVARVQLPEAGSAVVNVQRILGENVRVVSAFQNVSAHHLNDLDHKIKCDVLVCGDDVEARQETIKLVAAAGMRGIHGGPLVNSVAAEALTSVLIGINRRYKIPGAGIIITGLSDGSEIE